MSVLCSVLVVSCTSTTEPVMQLGLAPGEAGIPAAQASSGDAGAMSLQASAEANPSTAGGMPMPMPAPRAGADPSPEVAANDAASGEATGDLNDADTTASAEQEEPATTTAEDGGNDAATVASGGAIPADAAAVEDAASSETMKPATSEVAEEAASKRRGFLSAFFSPTPARAEDPVRLIERQPESQSQEATKPVITLASLPADDTEPKRAAAFGSDALPGVRKGEGLFQIKHASGSMSDDGNLDLYEDVDTYEVASAAGLARLAPNGLIKQRESVDVSCFKPSLLWVLKTIEHRYGKKVMVTSGYRSPSHNRRVRGARKSLHMYCAAADIQVEGVSKWELARFVRAMPGRGGVGTYCHTNSVHVDVGPERDWNWRCRRRK